MVSSTNNSLDAIRQKWQESKDNSNDVCLACGHCPHCGRGGHRVMPWIVPMPYVAPYPYSTTTGQSLPWPGSQTIC